MRGRSITLSLAEWNHGTLGAAMRTQEAMMQGIIQVAIGMIFVFSLLSVLVTTLNSVLTNVLQWRAKHLKAALETLITDQNVQQLFLQHPLINIVNPGEQATPKAEAASTE